MPPERQTPMDPWSALKYAELQAFENTLIQFNSLCSNLLYHLSERLDYISEAHSSQLEEVNVRVNAFAISGL